MQLEPSKRVAITAISRYISRFGAALEPSPTAPSALLVPPCGSFLAGESAILMADCVVSAYPIIIAESELVWSPRFSQNLQIYDLCVVRRGGVMVMVAPVEATCIMAS